ncbi:hypothetical protein FMEAI12_2320011 [Parafrankia sp. Ea1.12]|nr:hypothetical protein FMEAI12_2320011 [Parafrankia sp. Ea1.12]
MVDDPQQAKVLVPRRMFRGIRRFDRLFRLLLSEGDRVPEIRDTLGAALTSQSEPLPRKDHPTTVMLLAAWGGYHFFGLVPAPRLRGVPMTTSSRSWPRRRAAGCRSSSSSRRRRVRSRSGSGSPTGAAGLSSPGAHRLTWI